MIFSKTILNLTYSVYIDAITTFIVYLNYTFSSTIVLLTFKEMRQFWFDRFEYLWNTYIFKNRVHPIHRIRPIPTVGSIATVGPVRTVRYVAESRRITGI